MYIVGRYLFERLIPGGVVNSIYLTISVLLLFRSGFFSEWSREILEGLFWPLIISQFVQNIAFGFIRLLAGRTFRPKGLPNEGQMHKLHLQTEARKLLRIYGWLGLTAMVAYSFWLFENQADLARVIGAGLSCGFFIELILRELPLRESLRTYKTFMATSCVGFICALVMGNTFFHAFHHSDYDTSRDFGLWGTIFFGFRFIWEYSLGAWVEKVDSQAYKT